MWPDNRSKTKIKYVSNDDILHCGELTTRTSKEKKSSSSKKKRAPDDVENNFSNSTRDRCSLQPSGQAKTASKIQRSASLRMPAQGSRCAIEPMKLSSQSHSFASPISESGRRSTRKSRTIDDISDIETVNFDTYTPKKRNCVSTFKKTDQSLIDENNEEYNRPRKPQPRKSVRLSQKIESLEKYKANLVRISPFIQKSSKSENNLSSLRSNSSSKIRKSDQHKSLSDTEENSSSGPEEISSKEQTRPINTELESTTSCSASTPSHKHTFFSSSKSCRPATPSQKSEIPSTPKSSKLIHRNTLKTPLTVRRKLTKKFASMNENCDVDEESDSSSDFEDSSDEYVCSSSDSQSSSDDEDSDSSVAKETVLPTQRRIFKLNHETVKKKTDPVEFSYEIDADQYFLSKCSKDPTSNNQLSALEISHLEEIEIRNLLKHEYVKHETDTDSLIYKYKKEFPKWLFYLKESFNLLIYGLGSKIELLEYFHSEVLSAHDVITIHGYFPRLSMKDILNSLITDVLKINTPKNANEALPIVKSTLKSRKLPVFLIMHCVDRLLCEQRKNQSILSQLASFPYIHLIVSIDHINAPLLWGNSMLNELNFIWMNVTTYQPYIYETSFENLIYLTETGSDFVSLSSLRNIFKPLATRVKKIFKLIAKERLDNAHNKEYKGLSYEDWYRRAKAEFLVSNTTVFHVQLTELIDHGIIKVTDRQCIPILIKLDVLEKFYKEMFENEEEE